MDLGVDMFLDINSVSDMDWECTSTLTSRQLARLDMMKEKAVRIRRARARQSQFRAEVGAREEKKVVTEMLKSWLICSLRVAQNCQNVIF